MTMIRVSLAVLLAVTAVGVDGRARAGGAQQGAPAAPIPAPVITVPDGAAAVEQTTEGTGPAAGARRRFARAAGGQGDVTDDPPDPAVQPRR